MAELSTEAAIAAVGDDEADARLRREQLRIIQRTSVPGAGFCTAGALLLFALVLFTPLSAKTRNAYLAIGGAAILMAALWGMALYSCRRNDMRRAYLAQFSANVVSSILLLLFVEGGEVMAVITAFVGLSTGALVLDQTTLRNAGLTMAASVLVAGVLHELNVVDPFVLPRAILYTATTAAIVLGFRTPLDAFWVFNEHVQTSRKIALRLAEQAEEARLRADAQARRLSEVSEELREFTYVVSHDLRAPMINLQGFSAALGETLRDFDTAVRAQGDDNPLAAVWAAAHEEAAESMHFIARSTEKLNAMVAGLLDLSRLDSKPQRDQEVALGPLLDQIADSLQHQIRAGDIALHVGPLPTIVADPLRINQVFSNLLDNAIKYMPERPPRTITVACEQSKHGPVFSVTDSGNGIAAADRAAVFRPFRRLDPKDSAGGEGLGLAAVKKIIERRGGRIWIEDPASGPGTSFRFSWPPPPSVQ